MLCYLFPENKGEDQEQAFDWVYFIENKTYVFYLIENWFIIYRTVL